MKQIVQTNSAFQAGAWSIRQGYSNISTLPVHRTRIIVPQQTSWFDELAKKFDELTSLPVGWDGYVGRPVSFNCAHFAVTILDRLFADGVPAPQLVPGGDGTLQIEWHRMGYDIELDVLGTFDVYAVRRNLKTGDVEELLLQDGDYTKVLKWVIELEGQNVGQMMEVA